MDRTIELLQEEIARLRERVSTLEYRANQPVRDGHPLWRPVLPWPPALLSSPAVRHDEAQLDLFDPR